VLGSILDLHGASIRLEDHSPGLDLTLLTKGFSPQAIETKACTRFSGLGTIDSSINHHLSHPHLIVSSGYEPGLQVLITSILLRKIVICSLLWCACCI